MFKFHENIQEFSEINALYQHSPKTIDKFLENNDLFAIVFYCKKTFSKDEMTEDNVEEVIVDFVNYVCDNNLQPKYPSPLYLADTIKNVIDLCCNVEFGNIATFNEDGVFFIENTINETRSKVSAYFGSRRDALAGLSECADWFRPNGTGEIYFQPYGIGKHRILVMKVC